MKALYKEKVEKVAGPHSGFLLFITSAWKQKQLLSSIRDDSQIAAAVTLHHIHPFSMRVTVNKDYLLRVNDFLHTSLIP